MISTVNISDNYASILRCNRCGFCQNVCPTYLSSLDETQTARGRVRVARYLEEGRYNFETDKALIEKISDCLLCRSCVVNCPSSVPTDEIMLKAREDFLDVKGLNLFQRLVYRGVLSHRERLDRASALMRLYEKSGAGNILYARALRRALDKLVYFESFLPPKMQTPAKSVLPPVLRPDGRPKMKVAFFVGCASNVFGAQVVKSAVKYLVSRGVEVHLPKVACCGEPHRTAGDKQEVKRLARKNVDPLFNGIYDFIVSDCSTCAHALAHYDEFLGPDDPATEKVKPRLKQVVELNTLIIERLGLDKGRLKPLPATKITYHDSCHALRGLGVKEAPREIIKAIPGLELVEMEGNDSCCGGAGSYGFTHPEISGRIAARKVKFIESSQARILGVSCPACTLQLGAGLKRAGLNIEVKHPVELLAGL